MTAITAAVSRRRKGSARRFRALMANSITIPKGAIVQANASGLAVNATDAAGVTVLGIAAETISSGTGGNDWIAVECDAAWLFAASSITQAMVNTDMCVVDNNTVDDAAGPTNDIVVGKLLEFVTTTLGWVFVKGPTT